MTTRAFVAAILGGITMFIWSFLAHDLLPLGETGMREFKNEAAMLDALKTNLGDAHGLYHFPGHKAGPNATRQEKSDAMKRAMEKAASGPSGVLLYHSTREFSFGKLLGIEFATELLEAMLVVFLLTQTGIESFSGRIGFVFVAGILAAITTNIPYWNWYGFPSNYTAAYMSIEIIGFLCVGLVAALLLKNRSPASATTSLR
ncbi:MAG: hypothetical protein E6L06_07655 [Verrucomicrobia bacterium]|nr:MAG: hypothetical protein E6L06_07655 [Verrucomicrobiota bacterium]